MVVVRVGEYPLDLGHETLVFEEEDVKGVARVFYLAESHPLSFKDQGVAFVGTHGQ